MTVLEDFQLTHLSRSYPEGTLRFVRWHYFQLNFQWARYRVLVARGIVTHPISDQLTTLRLIGNGETG